jgi:tetraacyldisaccharide 4'-kinase
MTGSIATYWRNLASGKRSSLLDRLLLLILVPLSLPYALLQYQRSLLYRLRILGSKRLPRPVISIGNITVGGTGKTPVTALIARILLERGARVAVLSRGYGGTLEGQTAIVSNGREIYLKAEECGDEPFLLAHSIPGLMVVIGVDRHAAGMLAFEQLSPDIYLLDDGFQHLRLWRDLDILLLDYCQPFGNGWTLPAGLLREPKAAATRADIVIRTRCQEFEPDPFGTAGIPYLHARHQLVDVKELRGGDAIPLTALRGRKILAFAGIGEPEHFFNELRGHGLILADAITLPDHVLYSDSQIDALSDALDRSGAEYAITTEKDGVKLRQAPDRLAKKVFLAPLHLTIDNPSLLIDKLIHLLQKP